MTPSCTKCHRKSKKSNTSNNSTHIQEILTHHSRKRLTQFRYITRATQEITRHAFTRANGSRKRKGDMETEHSLGTLQASVSAHRVRLRWHRVRQVDDLRVKTVVVSNEVEDGHLYKSHNRTRYMMQTSAEVSEVNHYDPFYSCACRKATSA